jgi:tetratricopeptide (TPR) repeat protein
VLYAGILLIVAGVAHGVLVRVLTPIELPPLPDAPMLPVEVLEKLEDAGRLLGNREPEKAVALLEGAQGAFPDHAGTIKPALARALRVLGNRHLSVRDYQQAESAFEQAATLEADNPDNWIDLAKARREFGRSLQTSARDRGDALLRASVDAYNKALNIQPNMASAHVGLGQTYSFLNERTKAVDHFRKVVALAPGSPEARLAEEQLSQLVGRS